MKTTQILPPRADWLDDLAEIERIKIADRRRAVTPSEAFAVLSTSDIRAIGTSEGTETVRP